MTDENDILEQDGTRKIHRFLSDAEREGKADSTLSKYRTAMRRLIEWLDDNREEIRQVTGEEPGETIDDCLLQLQPVHLKHFALDLRNYGRADSSVRKLIDGVSNLYKNLEEYNDIPKDNNPVRQIDFSEILKNDGQSRMSRELKDDDGYVAISPDEYDGLINNLPDGHKARDELLFQLLWDTGMRPGEVAEIEIADIDRENREISIRSNKNHLNRTVFYGEKTATLLRIWLDGGERNRYLPASESDYLFISQRSEQVSNDLIEGRFRQAVENAGLEPDPVYIDAADREQYRLRPYSLRHGFAERMVDKGIDLETLRDVMGHKNLETTKQYVNPDKETRRNRIQSALDD